MADKSPVGQCIHTKKDGTRCKNQAIKGRKTCYLASHSGSGSWSLDRISNLIANNKAAAWISFIGLALTLIFGVVQLFFPTVSQRAAALFDPAPPFAVTLDVAFGSDRRDQGGFYAGCTRLGVLYLAPINTMLHIVIVNKTKHSQMIDSYGVEAKTQDGKWAPLVRIDKENRPVFQAISNKPLTGVQLSESSEFLDQVLQGKQIQPWETIQGYGLFEYPRDYAASTFSGEFRVTVRTFSGIEYMSGILTPLPDETRKPLIGVQPNMLIWLPGKIDLSRYPVYFFDDVISQLPASPPPLGGG